MVTIRHWTENVKGRKKRFILTFCLLIFFSVNIYSGVEGKNKRSRRREHTQGNADGGNKKKSRQRSKVKSTSEVELLKILESADALGSENKAEKAKKVQQLHKAYAFFKTGANNWTRYSVWLGTTIIGTR